VSDSIASANAAEPPVLYVDNVQSISSAHTNASDDNLVPGANHREAARAVAHENHREAARAVVQKEADAEIAAANDDDDDDDDDDDNDDMPSLGSSYDSNSDDEDSAYVYKESDDLISVSNDSDDPDPAIEQLQQELAAAEEQMEREEQVEQAEERIQMEENTGQASTHGMRLRENRAPTFQSYRHPKFDNMEF